MTPDTADDDGVLTPEELTLDDESVDRLGENRFVIRPERSSDALAPSGLERSDEDAPGRSDSPASTALGASTHVDALANADEPYGVDIALKTDDGVERTTVTSHDVREVFVETLRWYASQLDSELSPDETLRILLAASDIEL